GRLHVVQARPARAERAGGTRVQAVVVADDRQRGSGGLHVRVGRAGRVVADRLVEPVPVGVLRQRRGDQRLRYLGGEVARVRRRGIVEAVVVLDRPVVRLTPV